jgi:hypothetical protein
MCTTETVENAAMTMPPLPIETLLDAPDFASAVEQLAHAFRRRHRLPPVYQLGLVAPSVESATQQLENWGIGPFVSGTGAPDHWEERGELLQIKGKMALAYHAGLEIEVLEPTDGTAFYTSDPDGPSGILVHHLGVAVTDVDVWASRLEAAGLAIWVRGRLKLGPLNVEFAYMDTVAEAGTIIEFIAWRIRGRAITPAPGTITDIRRLERWLRQ